MCQIKERVPNLHFRFAIWCESFLVVCSIQRVYEFVTLIAMSMHSDPHLFTLFLVLRLFPGLPVQVRDSILAEHEKVTLASEDVNRGVQLEAFERAMENGTAALPYNKVAPSALLLRMARKTPYYQRNRAHICSFFVRGECSRGSSCPYRYVVTHDMRIL